MPNIHALLLHILFFTYCSLPAVTVTISHNFPEVFYNSHFHAKLYHVINFEVHFQTTTKLPFNQRQMTCVDPRETVQGGPAKVRPTYITIITFTKIYGILPMYSNVTIKNVSWPHFSWPTLYIKNCTNAMQLISKIQSSSTILLRRHILQWHQTTELTSKHSVMWSLRRWF